MSVKHNKKRIPSSNLLIYLNISKISTPNIVYKTFRFSNFLISCLCKSSADSCLAKSKGCWFLIFPFLPAQSEIFLLKDL